jgi:hypothetical protein
MILKHWNPDCPLKGFYLFNSGFIFTKRFLCNLQMVKSTRAFVPEKPFWPSVLFASNARAYLSEAPSFKSTPLW